MPKTLFIDSTPEIDLVWKRVHGAGDIPVTVNMGPVDEKDVPAKVAGYDTVINDATYFSAPTLEKCKDLKHIVFLGTGAASFVDVEAARKLGIKVSTISGYGDTTVAEHAMGLVFAAARHIATMHGIVRAGGWRPMQGMELRGKTLGIVGLGGIGREMARIAGGIGLKVLAWNRTPKPDTVPIETLLARVRPVAGGRKVAFHSPCTLQHGQKIRGRAAVAGQRHRVRPSPITGCPIANVALTMSPSATS